MARSNRDKRHRREEPEPLDIERLKTGFRRTESKRGYAYVVQPISESNAQKVYTCPGCNLAIEPGVAHLVAWRSDGIMGEQADVSERRHWHKHCWRIF
ncbi:MAG: hypothetical protein QNL53_06380 [Microbacteriaceae bacterium]